MQHTATIHTNQCIKGGSTVKSEVKDGSASLPKPASISRNVFIARSLSWYLIFGFLHEMAHLVSAVILATLREDRGFSFVTEEIIWKATSSNAWILIKMTGRVLFERRIDIPSTLLPAPTENDGGILQIFPLEDIVRHSGWIFSVLLSYGVVSMQSKVTSAENKLRSQKNGLFVSPIVLGVVITAMEAVSTDLFQLVSFGAILPFSHQTMATTTAATATFFCGNFGVILLNQAWMQMPSYSSGDKKTSSKPAVLDVLEKMTNVTMMRGAQSGGIVTYLKSSSSKKSHQLVGIRSRVVNRKRTDLSKLLRNKVQSDVFSSSSFLRMLDRNRPNVMNPSSDELTHAFMGHTRFATTSKATFEGTHPQQWTPPRARRMYNFNLIPSDKTSYLNSLLDKSLREGGMDDQQEDNRSTATRDGKIFYPTKVAVENYITHNGDFDFYHLNGTTYELDTIQKWLEIALQSPIPASVDSAAIAGLIDLLRTQGCFGLSIRYAVCLGLSSSRMTDDAAVANLPGYEDYEKIGVYFEQVLDDMLRTKKLEEISSSLEERRKLSDRVEARLECEFNTILRPVLGHYVSNEEDEVEEGITASLYSFVNVTVDAFFDNDLLHTTKTFLANAKGSFGLCISSSLDAHRQICLAARGQTMSIAFYPTKGLICYGSEQAAVKAGITIHLPGAHNDVLEKSHLDIDNDALRLDLDDLGGEVCLLDWGVRTYRTRAISPPSRSIAECHQVMNGSAAVYLIQESQMKRKNDLLYHRMTRLTRNQFIKPLQEESDDLVLSDIKDIPRVCRRIQDDWHNSPTVKTMSLNRLTMWNLGRCLRKRMEMRVNGEGGGDNVVDILLTGCEVSLWLAEQFASDLQKAFPKLVVRCVSSNKFLGLHGQEISIPAIGFPMSSKTQTINDAIVIIVSHSGGTFAPLACSNLLQSTTQNIFVVTSEWDTQIGKQLRSMNKSGISASRKKDDSMLLMFNSRIFTTEVGMRPAEPCSVSVAATHQLLTNIFEHMCIVILSDFRYRHASGAVITERDLQVLERCNQDNIEALESIVGVDANGDDLDCGAGGGTTTVELIKAGDVWAEHILENAKAYIMSFFYVFVTVTVGYPLLSLLATAAGLPSTSSIFYLVRFFDAAIYFFLPQINVIILRLIQRRKLLHRMVGRTVVVGDIPWVAQAAEAFLSKIFACSYSIAGLNVLSANPSDHLVHRHTHRVVRGTLLVCGRPDGRLSALSSAEASVCLSVNQASSIQSIGGTCESVTIGHNPFKLPLSARAIFLGRHRPQFLCEKILGEVDIEEEKARRQLLQTAVASDPDYSIENDSGRNRNEFEHRWSLTSNISSFLGVQTTSNHSRNRTFTRQNSGNTASSNDSTSNESQRSLSSLYPKISYILGKQPKNKKLKSNSSTHGNISRQHSRDSLSNDEDGFDDQFFKEEGPPESSCRPQLRHRSSTALLGAYINLEKKSMMKKSTSQRQLSSIDELVNTAIQDKKTHNTVRELFDAIDVNGKSTLDKGEFVSGYSKLNPYLSTHHIEKIFEESDVDENGCLDFEEFSRVIKMTPVEIVSMLQAKNRDERGLIQVEPSNEEYFGEKIRKGLSTDYNFSATRSQYFSQELYETRIASLQRFVSMTVMFHRMGKRVQEFFPKISFGLLGYRMDRTHSIMRIATTASPVSGADVRERMQMLHLLTKINRSVHIITVAWLKYKEKKKKNEMDKLLEHYNSTQNASSSSSSTDDIAKEPHAAGNTPVIGKGDKLKRRHSSHA